MKNLPLGQLFSLHSWYRGVCVVSTSSHWNVTRVLLKWAVLKYLPASQSVQYWPEAGQGVNGQPPGDKATRQEGREVIG